MTKPQRVLITKLASMGDLIHLLPALTDAKKAHPGLVFDWMVDKNFQEVASWHPAVDKKVLTNHRKWRSNLSQKETWKEAGSMIRILKEQSYDLIIDAQGNIKSALLSLFAKGPIAGFNGSSIREWGAHFFYKKTFPASKQLHAVTRLRILLARALNYPLPNTPPDYQITQEKLVKPTLSLPTSYLLFVPIASHSSKLWPEEHWKQLIEEALAFGHSILIPSGNTIEKQRAQRLAIHSNVIALPKLSLSEVAYITSLAKAVVSLDTGISHIAAALGTPCVSLYGPTDPLLTGTLGQNQIHISASPIHQITPAKVMAELSKITKPTE